MRLLVGSFPFAVNSTDVRRRVSAVLSDRGKPVRYTHTLTVRGELEGDSQAELSAASAALQAALLTQYQDIVFLDDSGSPTDTALYNGTSISGVRVLDLDFPNDYGGAEYATLRSFSFVAQADYLAGPDDTVRYSESIAVTGTGGPVFRMRTPISGPPVKQMISTHSPVRATQSGEWVGLLKYPPIAPAPLWRDHELVEQRVVRKLTPRVGGGGYFEYPIAWSYSFESAGPLTGPPGNPPRV